MRMKTRTPEDVMNLVKDVREGHNFQSKYDPECVRFDEQVERCRAIIREHLPSKAKSYFDGRGSYGLKHDFEQYSDNIIPRSELKFDPYVTEEAAIAAMALEGFQWTEVRCLIGGKYNYKFNIAKKEYRTFVELARRFRSSWQ